MVTLENPMRDELGMCVNLPTFHSSCGEIQHVTAGSS